jgi:hypothetical protein
MHNDAPTLKQLNVLFDAILPHMTAIMQARDDLQDAFNGMREALQQFVVLQAGRQAGSTVQCCHHPAAYDQQVVGWDGVEFA